MSTLAAFYNSLPFPAQHLACSLEGWRIQRDRFSRRFSEIFRDVEARGNWDAARVIAWRDARIRTAIEHAFSHTMFYRDRLRVAGIKPSDIDGLADLGSIPLLTKADVKKSGDSIRDANGAPLTELREAHTSGTTGGGLKFLSTADALREQWAVWWRYRRWHGIQMGTWCGYFGGRSVVPISHSRAPFWRYNIPGRQILFSAYHIARANLGAYVDELRRRRPPWLHGYPSLLALIAFYILDTRSDLGYQVRWITTGAESLLANHVDLIQRAFGVRPRQHYGMAEAVANFSECELGRLHVDEDFAGVEFLPATDGSFRVVGTNFSNRAMPLIRYAVQDHVTLTGERCSCGRPGRIVASIDGRAEDYIVLPNGARVGRLDHIFKDLVNITEAQIYQRKVGEVIVRVVRGPLYAEADEQQLLAEVRDRIGAGCEIHLDYVNAVERAPNGKLRFVISELSEARIGKPAI